MEQHQGVQRGSLNKTVLKEAFENLWQQVVERDN
jgi:hypothetical protein